MTYPPPPLWIGLISPETLPLLPVLAGLGLSFVEAIALGAHFIVLGVVLLVAGLADPLIASLASPIIPGLLVSVFDVLAFYGYRELDVYGGKGRGKTGDSDALTGRMERVVEYVTPTSSETKLDEGDFNPYYAAQSVHGELETGIEVIVIDSGGGDAVTVEGVGLSEGETDRELARERTRWHEESAERDGGELEREDTEGV